MEREDRTGRKHRRVGWTLFWGLTVVAGFLFGVYHGERKSSTALFGRGGFSGKVDALQCPTCPRCEPTRCPDPARRECPKCEGAAGSGVGSSHGATAPRDAEGAKTTEAVVAKREDDGDANGGDTAGDGGDGDAGGCPRCAPCPKCGSKGTCPDPPRCGDGAKRARGAVGVGAGGGCSCDECPVCKGQGECPAHPPCRT